MKDWIDIVHGFVTLIASFAFFVTGIRRAIKLWGVEMPEERRAVLRTEAMAWIVLSQVLIIGMYVRS